MLPPFRWLTLVSLCSTEAGAAGTGDGRLNITLQLAAERQQAWWSSLVYRAWPSQACLNKPGCLRKLIRFTSSALELLPWTLFPGASQTVYARHATAVRKYEAVCVCEQKNGKNN